VTESPAVVSEPPPFVVLVALGPPLPTDPTLDAWLLVVVPPLVDPEVTVALVKPLPRAVFV